ncbi:MAG: polysaccharide pyruvyl transferase family protein [Clostridia bacterium]
MKDKKICTITHHTVPNFGAVLQAYALQQAILKLGYSSEILNYQPARVKRFYHQTLFSQNNLKEIIRHCIYRKEFKLRNNMFSSFVNEYLKLSKTYSDKTISSANDCYDLFITGSDQVWNLVLHQGNKRYMLDFVESKDKKSSYAASFGYNEIPEKYIEETRNLLKEFKDINVREDDAIPMVKKLLGENIEVNQVLDPTLLLDKSDWEKLVHPIEFQNYILVYEICRLKETYDYARKIARKTGKKIIAIQPFGNIHKIEDNEIEYIIELTPEKFLSLIYYADYIITSSFHGTIFSIIFEKQFFCTINNETSLTNSRLESLLRLCDLPNRKTGIDNFDFINYEPVKEKLKAKQEISIRNLNKIIL